MPSCGARDDPIRTVEISRRAAREIARARAWWIANRDKAPDAFDEELDALVTRLEEDADHIGAQQRGANRRRVLLKRIRYYVYFRVVGQGDVVEILALWHASRGREPKFP